MTSEVKNPEKARREALKVAVSALCCEVGFSHADESCLETLTEMLQSFITELGRSTRAFSELSCRTDPMISDVVMSLVEMGQDVQKLQAYTKRNNKMRFMPPEQAIQTQSPRTLQVGQKSSHPSHIPDYLPPFPDPHTYIKTLTLKPPETKYKTLREKAATQKRDVERALTRFIAKTGETESLFSDDPFAFPLIACKPKHLPYLDALLPKDQDLDAQEEQEDPAAKKSKKEQEKESEKPPPVQTQESQDTSSQNISTAKSPTTGDQNNSNVENTDNENQIDNPYLRPIKMPSKLKGKSKSKLW